MKDKRLNEMRAYLKEVHIASYDELAQHFNRSINTIRRDIAILEVEGWIKKTHAGVTYQADDNIITVATRILENQEEKFIIAKLSSQILQDGEIVFIDSGTTATSLLQFLEDKKNLTIVTANLEVITKASNMPNVTLISLGGTYCNYTNSFSGVNTVENLKSINIAKAFLSATCISIENGLSSNSYLESEIKKAVIAKKPKIIAMLDSSKFDKSAILSFIALNEIDVLVTDKKIPEKYKLYLDESNIPFICEQKEDYFEIRN